MQVGKLALGATLVATGLFTATAVTKLPSAPGTSPTPDAVFGLGVLAGAATTVAGASMLIRGASSRNVAVGAVVAGAAAALSAGAGILGGVELRKDIVTSK